MKPLAQIAMDGYYSVPIDLTDSYRSTNEAWAASANAVIEACAKHLFDVADSYERTSPKRDYIFACGEMLLDLKDNP